MSWLSQNNAPFGLGIVRNDVNNFTAINKFGHSSTVGSTFQTVWDGNNVYPWPSSAGTLTIASDSGSDNNAVVTVEGLDSDWNLQSEELTITGAVGTKSFIRIYRAYVKTPGTGQTTNVGNISITHTTVVRAKIIADAGQTLMAIYSVPAGYTAYILKFQGSMAKQKECQFRGRFRLFGGAFRTGGQWGSFGVPVTYDYPVPLTFPAKTDFEIQVLAGATTEAGAIFDIILEKVIQS